MEEDNRSGRQRRSRSKMVEKYGLDSFLHSPKDLPRVEKHRRFLECKRQIISLLSKKPMGMRVLWFQLDKYRDVRQAVLTKLRNEKVIKIRWFVNPLEEKGEYYLVKRKNRKNTST